MGSKYNGPDFHGKRDIINYSWYRAVRPLESGMMVVEWLLDERLCIMVTVNEMQFGLLCHRIKKIKLCLCLEG